MLNPDSPLPSWSRRQLLSRAAHGFGAVALASLLRESALGARPPAGDAAEKLTAEKLGALDHVARARSVIFLYMDGGPSQVDTFDPKPRLDREHGQPIKMRVPHTQFNNVGTVLRSPWKFRQWGKCGTPVSELFPHTAQMVDDMAIVRSMVSNFSEHTNANYFLHTGSGQQGRPSMGSWVTYGLGTDCHELPGFVVLNGGLMPRGGVDNFQNGFLPASFQGSIFRHGSQPVANLASVEGAAGSLADKRLALAQLDRQLAQRAGQPDELEAAIANYELAFRMQSSVPGLVDLASESAATHRLYGIDASYGPTRVFGQMCLLARRLVERGVRFIELTCPGVEADRWDQHSNLVDGHTRNAQAVDQPIAGLLRDLKSRGLLDETLVVWAGEFGRTPMAQGNDGRDHNPFGFSIWLAGGGIRGGTIYGATDDYGYFVAENKVEIHDLHATMLHLLGVDHTRMTYRFGGRDMRLTDVHGRVVQAILA